MTTLAWDGVTLAADKQCTTGYMLTRVTKIYSAQWFDGRDCLIGMTGDLGFCTAFKQALVNGDAMPKPADYDLDKKAPIGMCITRDGTPHTITPQGNLVAFDEVYFAMGSGCEAAWGALEAGATAKNAVKIAIKRTEGSGFEIDELRFDMMEKSISGQQPYGGPRV